MDQDNSELIQFLGEKFDNIDSRFNDLSSQFSDLQKSVDAYAKKADTYFQEMVMLSHKVDKIEKWVLQMADKMGMKLQY